MDYDPSDSSGTDDDLPPSHQNQGARGGRVTGNGRSASGALQHLRGQNDMETQIHWLEQEAYSSVLRAFKAQSDAITWEKESLITELRKELRVSDEEHRELLTRVNADDIIRRIREWRQAGGSQSGLLTNVQPVHDSIPSPTVSASRKRQKTSQSLGPSPPAQHTQPVNAPSSSAAIRGSSVGSKGKKTKPGQTVTGISTMKSLQIPSTGSGVKGQITNRNSSGALAHTEPVGATAYNPLIGRKVWTRWPEDNSFYEAVITDYNPREISPEDIRWEGEDPGLSRRPGQGKPGPGIKKLTGQSNAIPGAGMGRCSLKNQSIKDLPPSTNGHGKKRSDDIEILHTETLIKEIERVFTASHPDPLDIEKAKKSL